MSVLAHTGHPRQGKTYSAVLYIIAQLVRGRRVVTNIEGMGTEKRRANLQALVEAGGGSWDPERFVHVPHSQIEKSIIFPVDMKREDEDGVRVFDDSQSVLKFGDALVWDEARLWKTGKLPEIWADALDYHGHWSRAGFSTDLLIITPAWMNLAPAVRRIVELVYVFDKHPGGKGFTRYIYKTPGDVPINLPNGALDIEQFQYDPAAFECYATNNDPTAEAADTVLVNPWRTWRVWRKVLISLAMLLGFGGFVVWLLWGYVSSSTEKAEKATENVQGEPQRADGGSRTGAAFGTASVDNTPRVVGIIPSAFGGRRAVIRAGEKYEFVRIEANTIQFRGEVMPWPEGF